MFEDFKWKARDYRPRNLNLNPKKIVDLVNDYHKNPWLVRDIKKYKTDNYYQEFKNNPKLFNINSDKKIWLNKFVKNNQKILDIGCGFLINLLWKK